MESINQYIILRKLRAFNDNIQLWLAESESGTNYEILTILKNKTYERIINRLIKGALKPLVQSKIEGTQTIIEISSSHENNCHFIVYEELQGFSFLDDDDALKFAHARSILDIAKGLDILKKQNREVFVIDPRTIKINPKGETYLCFLGLFDLFKQQELLSSSTLAPNVQTWLTDRNKGSKPRFQDDIYALIKTFEPILEYKIETKTAFEIIERGLAETRIERYAKYHELITQLAELPIEKLSTHEAQHPVKVVHLKDKTNFEALIADMNISTWIALEQKRSEKNNAIVGRFSTQNWQGKFIVDTKNYLFIPHFNKGKDEKLIKKKASFLVNFVFGIYSSNYDINAFFNKKYEEINQLAALNRNKTDLLKQWKTLPAKELEYIEEQAFKAKYKKVKSGNSNCLDFYLVETDRKTWTKVKQLKNEKVELFIDDQKIGTILNYKPKEQILSIAEPNCTIDEIASKGELIEDTRQETSQFKKQVEACNRFEQADVANPIICDILATPDNAVIPHCNLLDEEAYEDFNEQIYNADIKNDSTQKEAVLEALNYKPIYLIQGPPGTGKTTVIVELIRQILKKKVDAKILVTSQSNLAVDNVLEKIENINNKEKQQMLFMRLASDHSIKKDNIREIIQPHTFENKLKKWVDETISRAEKNLTEKFPKASKNKELRRLYQSFETNNRNWEKCIQQLRMKGSYIQKLFEHVNTSKEAFRVFERELGKDFLTLEKIQKDWVAFLTGVTDNDGESRKRSMLNDGSTEIDFLTAMMREINIIGATCIHIASGKYSNINFQFDYVIMDESSKASPSETLVPINMGQHIILIGDHKQLPPVVTREVAVKKKVKEELEDNGLDFSKDFGISLFEQLVHAFEEDEKKQQYIKMLDIQYRMPKQVGTLISNYFYDKKLQNPKTSIIPNYDTTKEHGLKLKVNTSILFISTSNEKYPYDNDDKFKRSNKCNVQKIKTILEELNEHYTDNLQRKEPFSIGIIAGYRGQVELLKKTIDVHSYSNFNLKKGKNSEEVQELISINTVDKFQGAERDIIIYDVVRSSRGSSVIGFLDDYRRINVAFSRVKRLLIVVGDADYLIKRARLHPDSKFKEFKLQQIAKELQENGYVFHSLKEALT